MYSTNFDEKYVIDGKMGEGAFGCVMRCKQKATANLKEISILRKIPDHLNVLCLCETYVNRSTRQVTLVFPLMELNLEEYIRTTDNISEKRAKEILYQIVNGLHHLHSYKVFHRDIKPENILIRGDLVVVGDLGSLQFIKSKGLHTEYIATRWYRSPECLLTEGYYSFELDIWAAGCVFYETLTRNPLFPGDSEIDQLDRIHQVLGTPKAETLKKFEKYKSSNFTYQFKQYPGGGIDVLVPQIHEKGKKLMSEMLKYDPKRRPTAQKILSCAYFADLTQLKQYLEQKQVMKKLAKKNYMAGGMQKTSHPTHLLANTKSSHQMDMSKFIQSDLNTHQTKKTKSDFFSQARTSKYRFDQSSSIVLHPKNPPNKSKHRFDQSSSTVLHSKNPPNRSKLDRKIFLREKIADEESRRKIHNEFLERKSKIKQKLNLMF
ncbi:hypothetical protein M8J76_002039 [Diaphorina citri]|nr:hypothetical protein M8J76_002039 [Diaphorina citri]